MTDEVLPKKKGKFSRIPKTIEKRGRAVGFTKIRDKLLKDWEFFSAASRSPLAVLKTVIEMDRHAMFAEVQASKLDSTSDDRYAKFQKYLEGDDSGAEIEAPDKSVTKAVDTIDEMILDHADELMKRDEDGKEFD